MTGLVLPRPARLTLLLVVLALLVSACSLPPRPPARDAGPPATVTVQRGDSVYLIARRHGVPMQEVIALNNLREPYTIHPGQVLTLPSGGSAGAQSARAMLVPSEPLAAPLPPRRPGSAGSASTATAQADGPAIVPPRTVAVTPMPSPSASPESQPQTAASPSVVAAPPPPVVAAPPPTPAGPITPPSPAASGGPPPEPPARAGSRFLWPVEGRILSRFGTVSGGLHNDGINIAAERGTPIRAAENGIVAYAGNELRGYGNLILIRHADGWVTAYAHTDEMRVQRGQEVRAGEIIATVGSTGAVNTPQLHFELRQGTRAVDPLRELPPPTAQMSGG